MLITTNTRWKKGFLFRVNIKETTSSQQMSIGVPSWKLPFSMWFPSRGNTLRSGLNVFLRIDWLESVIRPIGNISTIKQRGLLFKGDQFWNFEVSIAALTSLLFIEIQYNGLLRAKGVVILDTGHPLIW